MAFDERLAERIRGLLKRKKGIEEMRMFGCVIFLLHGNMLVGVWKDSLIARVGPQSAGELILEPHVKAMNITGKPMKGWLMIVPEGIAEDDALKVWIQRAHAFVSKLPKK
jgi:hypothetical protein